MNRIHHRIGAYSGLAAIAIFAVAFMLGTVMVPTFDPLQDYISTLGTSDRGLGVAWSLIAFGLVGILMAAFGWLYGSVSEDRWISVFLALAGVGFAWASVPTDFSGPETTTSAVHFAAICISLGGWCLAMSRVSGLKHASESERKLANYIVAACIGVVVLQAVEVLPEPLAHRLLVLVIFGWVSLTCLAMLKRSPKLMPATD